MRLQWPAVFPILIYVAIHLTYTWPQAKLSADGPQYATSYLIGWIMGGILASYIIAGITFPLSGRSSKAATIAFSVALLLFSVRVFQNSRAEQKSNDAGTPAAAPVAGPPVRFPVVGVSLTPPAGWQPVPPDHKGTIAGWASPSSRTNDLRAMIIVEWDKATSNDVGDHARELAAAWGGRLTGEMRDIDGVKAYLLKADPQRGRLKPVEGLAVLHDAHFFFLIGGVTHGESVSDELEQIRKSWKWIAVELPTAHLDFRENPLRALGNRITINYPAIATMSEAQDTRSLIMHIPDFQRSDTQLEAAIDLVELPNPDSFDVVRERMSKSTGERLKLPEALTWRAVSGPTRRAITQPVPSSDGTYRMIFSLIDLESRRFILINFSIFASQPQERAAYAAVAEKVVESIKPAP